MEVYWGVPGAESPATSRQLSRERLMRLGWCQKQPGEIYTALGGSRDQACCEHGGQAGIERAQRFVRKGA